MQIDPVKFRGLVEQHQNMVFSIALRVTGEFGVAEEVAQDTFLELHRSGERLESEDHVRFWLRRVTVHRATDALRSRQRRPEAAAEEWIDEQHSDVAGPGLDFGTARGSTSCCEHCPRRCGLRWCCGIRKRCCRTRLPGCW